MENKAKRKGIIQQRLFGPKSEEKGNNTVEITWTIEQGEGE